MLIKKIYELYCKHLKTRVLKANFFIALLNFITSILLIKVLSKDNFGAYLVVSNFILMGKTIFGVNSGEALLRFLDKNICFKSSIEITSRILFFDIIVNCTLFLIIQIGCIIYAYHIKIDYLFFFVFSFHILLTIGFSIYENLFIYFNKIDKFYSLKLYSTILILIFVTLGANFFQIWGAIIGYLIGHLITNIIYLINVRDYIDFYKIFSKNDTTIKFNKFYNFIKHSYLSTTFKVGSDGLDIFLLSSNIGVGEIALYGAAKKFARIPALFIGSIWTSKYNAILNWGKNKEFNKILSTVNYHLKLFIPIGVIILIIIYIFGKVLIINIFGNDYIDCFTAAIIFFIFYWVSNILGGAGRIFFISIDRLSILTILNGILFCGILFIGFFFSSYNINLMALNVGGVLLLNSSIVYYYIIKKKNDVQ